MAHCDLCTATTDGGTRHSVAAIQRAVRAGLRPPGAVFALGAAFGPREMVENGWVAQVMGDTTDWILCPNCTERVQEIIRPITLTHRPSLPKTSPQPTLSPAEIERLAKEVSRLEAEQKAREAACKRCGVPNHARLNETCPACGHMPWGAVLFSAGLGALFTFPIVMLVVRMVLLAGGRTDLPPIDGVLWFFVIAAGLVGIPACWSVYVSVRSRIRFQRDGPAVRATEVVPSQAVQDDAG